MATSGVGMAAQEAPRSKRQRTDCAEGAGDELTSLLAAMHRVPEQSSSNGELSAGSARAGSAGALAGYPEAEVTTKLAESAPQRHKALSPRHASSSDTSSGDSSSSSGDESSDSGTDSEDSGPWVTPHDPNRPKRPKTSYFMFLAAERKRVPGGAVANPQKLSAAWHAMTNDEKRPFEEMAAKDAQRYKQAIANYVAPAKIQLSVHPTPEQERLYAADLARYRAQRERKRQRRRAIAQARREQREQAREQQRLARLATLEAERLKQAQDVARLRERNLGSTGNSGDKGDVDSGDKGDVDSSSMNEGGSEAEHAASEHSSDADIKPTVRRRSLRARSGVNGRAAQSDSADSHGGARTLRSRSGLHSEREVKKQACDSDTASTAPAREAVAVDQDNNAKSDKQASWREALDVWSPLLCQDVTMAWYEALVVDVRGYEVLIRYIAWDHSFDEWVPRSSARLAERGTRLLAHMSEKDVLDLPAVTEEQALTLEPGTLIWLKWESPGVDGHNEWWSASIRQALYDKGSSEIAKTAPKRNVKKKTGWNTTKKSKSKLARAWKGWYKLDFTSFICNDGFDLRDAASKDNLRLGDKTKTL